ncbi:hypothetical protein H1R20_g216, partial [Candolleomyces eurysporus]
MDLFTFSSTRSGKAYNSFPVVPIVAPPTFELTELLKQALVFDNDKFCTDDFFEEPGGLGEGQARANAALGSSIPTPAGPCCWQESSKPCVPTVNKRKGVGDGGVEDGELAEGGRKAKRKRRRAAHRRKQADAHFVEHGQVPRDADRQECIQTSTQIPVTIDLGKLPSTSCGYRARNMDRGYKLASYNFEALKAEGYTVVPFEPGISKPLVDSSTGKNSCERAFEFLEQCRTAETFHKAESDHRRGDFPAVNYGITYGPGSFEPVLLQCRHNDMMARILLNEHVIRLATFASYLFSMWAPNVYAYYKGHLDKLYHHMPDLPRIFTRSVWPCAAFNFGPQVCTVAHRDCLNCPFGWCAIQALGAFDHTRGGHLILPDLKLLIEFPAGAIILIPSATLVHANTPVQPGERRISFTQFCAGGLFRYADNGFRTEDQFKAEDPEGYQVKMDEKKGRWQMGIGLWSTLEELLTPSHTGPA